MNKFWRTKMRLLFFVVVIVVVVVVICRGRSICCCGYVDGNVSSLITLVHYLSAEIGKILNFNQFIECVSDGRADGQTDGQTDYPPSRDAKTHLKTLLLPFPSVNSSIEPSFS